jgi:hypothetical protein
MDEVTLTGTETSCPNASVMATLVMPPPTGVMVKLLFELEGVTVATDAFPAVAVNVPV